MWKYVHNGVINGNKLCTWNVCLCMCVLMNAARQMGFHDNGKCPYLCKLACDYIRREEGCEEDMYSFFGDDPEADSLFIKLVEEFERCILSYFAFHWSQASFMITQVNNCLPTHFNVVEANQRCLKTNRCLKRTCKIRPFVQKITRYEILTPWIHVYVCFSWLFRQLLVMKFQVLGPDGHEPKKKLKNIVMQATRYNYIFLFLNKYIVNSNDINDI